MTTPRQRARRRASGPLRSLILPVALLLALAATSCSSDDDGSQDSAPEPTATRSTAKPPPEVRTKVSIERVPGKLSGEVRKRVRHQIGDVVDRWFEKAYVGGRYPRTDFHDAFPGFTPKARALAHHDKALMTNQPLGKRIDSVRATQRLVWIDVLPAGGRAAAATARFRLEFTTTGKVEKDIAVRGRLFLTPGPKGWKVFGYDVAEGSPSELAPPKEKDDKPSKDRKGKKHHHAKGGGR